MPEPDFKQIARRLMVLDAQGPEIGDSLDQAALEIAEQLRQVWNARGAADREAMDDEMLRVRGLIDTSDVGDLEGNVDRILKALDR